MILEMVDIVCTPCSIIGIHQGFLINARFVTAESFASVVLFNHGRLSSCSNMCGE